MTTNNSSSSGGISFTGALTILFIGLKLCNVIHWSWWWVLSPIWISALIVLTVLATILMFAVINEVSK
jgi:predicted tellurium resistance membrane protein TerC